MKRAKPGLCRSPTLVVRRRRGGFGLDGRPPDLGRVEREILAWLAHRVPEALPMRAASLGPAGTAEPSGPAPAPMLVLLLPGGRPLVLCVEAPGAPGPASMALAGTCARRNIPLAVVGSLDETRAALRRWGLDPERR